MAGMKYGMFTSYTEAIGYLLASAMISGGIVWIAITIIQWIGGL